MPTDVCLFFYDCSQCNAQLKPKPGDCCVFCSYGSVACPPIQIMSSVARSSRLNELIGALLEERYHRESTRRLFQITAKMA
jgi:hypothetical protein